MPGRRNEPVLHGPEAFLSAIRESGHALRQQFERDPVALAERLGVMLPEKPVTIMLRLGVITPAQAVARFGELLPGLRELVEDICLLEEESAVVVGPRGGGKSMGVSFIEFFLVFILMFDALNLGGSELQADQVYRYLLGYLASDPYWLSLVEGDPMKERTDLIEGQWIRVLTASQRSVRSPHAGGRLKPNNMAGGILVIDEEAEADPEIVAAALPTVNTARPSINIRCSTFHNAVGSFAEVVEDHEEMGYKLYGWDVFDICAGCDCVGDGCQSEEKCFREDHIEKYINPDTGLEEERLVHRAYCGGRAKYARGWVLIGEIVKMWRRWKRNHATFEIEAMGSRPQTRGHVITGQRKFEANHVELSGRDLYMAGCAVSVCVDWGTGTAALSVWQEQPGDRHALLHAELVEDAGPDEMVGKVMSEVAHYINDLVEVAADSLGGGNYMNRLLEERHFLPVRDVVFSEEKETAAKAWNIYNDAGLVIYPNDVEDFDKQVKGWRRKDGRIIKKNDHLPDTGICYFAKFIERLGIPRVHVAPATFSTGARVEMPSTIPNGAGNKSHNGNPRSHTPHVAPVVPTRRR